MKDWLDKWRKVFTPKKPELEPAKDKTTPWIKIGLILRDIDVNKMLVGLITVPVIVFFTLSGVLAWCVVAIKFAVSIYNSF